MEEWIGAFKETIDERPKIRQKINDYIHKYFHKEMSLFTDQDILKIMIDATKLLKMTDIIETRSKIEYEKYNTTSYPAFLWQEKYIASFYLFVVMIGYIDKIIDDEQSNIDFNEKFLFADNEKDHMHQDEIDESRKAIQKHIISRNLILEQYKNICDANDSHMIFETLEICPSYNNFHNLYNDQKEHGTQLYLCQQLIIAYNLGYMYNKCKYNEVFNLYNSLYKELLARKEINEKSIYNQKQEISRKKIK